MHSFSGICTYLQLYKGLGRWVRMMAVGANRKTAGFASAGHENHVVAGGRCIQHALFTSLGRFRVEV